jgi:hypothetical protein
MLVDRYTKTLLTIIAMSLAALVINTMVPLRDLRTLIEPATASAQSECPAVAKGTLPRNYRFGRILGADECSAPGSTTSLRDGRCVLAHRSRVVLQEPRVRERAWVRSSEDQQEGMTLRLCPGRSSAGERTRRSVCGERPPRSASDD